MRKFLISLITLISVLSTSIVILPATAHAAVDPACDRSFFVLGFPVWYKYLDVGPDSVTGDDCAVLGPSTISEDGRRKIAWDRALPRVALAVIEIMLRIAALVAVGYVMYGGFRYILSQGEPDNAKTARQTIINGLIGLVISMIATGTVMFIAAQMTS